MLLVFISATIHIPIYIFAGDCEAESEVLDWLRKNRYRQPELNVFMYALIALTLAFISYTAFLLYGFPHLPAKPS